jgi:hypothetical protein
MLYDQVLVAKIFKVLNEVTASGQADISVFSCNPYVVKQVTAALILSAASGKLLGWCIGSCGSLTLPNNLFFTQIIKPSINYLFSSVTHDCPATFGQVFDPTLEEIRRFGREEVEEILELSVVVEGNSAQIVRERAEEVVIRWDKVWRVWGI